MPVPQRLSRKEYRQKRKEAKFYGFQVLLTLHQLRRYIEHASNLITTTDYPDLVHSNPKIDEALANSRKNLREKIFPEALYYSFIILLYGVIETSLKRTCDLFHEMRLTPLRAKDLSGGTLTLSKCMTFLDKLGGVPRDSIRSLPHIEDLAKVRNCIVHVSGFMEGFNDRDKIQQLAANSPDLIQLRAEGDRDDAKLVLSLKYCSVSVEHALHFFEEIFRARRVISAEEIEFIKRLNRVGVY